MRLKDLLIMENKLRLVLFDVLGLIMKQTTIEVVRKKKGAQCHQKCTNNQKKLIIFDHLSRNRELRISREQFLVNSSVCFSYDQKPIS